MNPSDSSPEDPLDALLGRPAAPLPDDGFTARVLASLPPVAVRPRRAFPRRSVFMLAGTALGTVAAFARVGIPDPAGWENAAVRAAAWWSAVSFSDSTVQSGGIALAAVACSLAFAYKREIVRALDQF